MIVFFFNLYLNIVTSFFVNNNIYELISIYFFNLNTCILEKNAYYYQNNINLHN